VAIFGLDLFSFDFNGKMIFDRLKFYDACMHGWMTRGVRSIAKGGFNIDWMMIDGYDIFQLPQLQFLQTLFRHHQFKYQDGSSTSKERIKPQTSKSFTTFRVTFLSYSMVVVLELRAGA
jgi:hypothetical protein